MWPFKTRRERDLEAELESVKADRERIRGERNQFEQDRNTHKASAETSSRLYVETDEKYVDVCRELAAVRKVEESLARQIHEMAQPVEPSDEEVDAAQLRLEHDVHRKALADALGEQKRHLGWDALIGEAGGLAASVADLTQRLLASEERARTAKTRADVESRPVDGASAVTATEARLRAELSRSEKARGALEEQCRVLQKANEVDARQLRALREGSKP